MAGGGPSGEGEVPERRGVEAEVAEAGGECSEAREEVEEEGWHVDEELEAAACRNADVVIDVAITLAPSPELALVGEMGERKAAVAGVAGEGEMMLSATTASFAVVVVVVVAAVVCGVDDDGMFAPAGFAIFGAAVAVAVAVVVVVVAEAVGLGAAAGAGDAETGGGEDDDR